MSEYEGKYTVLKLDMKLCWGNTWLEMRDRLWAAIRMMVEPHLPETLKFEYSNFPYDVQSPSSPVNPADFISLVSNLITCLDKRRPKTLIILLV